MLSNVDKIWTTNEINEEEYKEMMPKKPTGKNIVIIWCQSLLPFGGNSHYLPTKLSSYLIY